MQLSPLELRRYAHFLAANDPTDSRARSRRQKILKYARFCRKKLATRAS